MQKKSLFIGFKMTQNTQKIELKMTKKRNCDLIFKFHHQFFFVIFNAIFVCFGSF